MQRSDAKPLAAAKSRPTSMPRGARARMLRWGINLCVVLHFTAILAAAGSVGLTSGYILAVWDFFHPYLQSLSLNHGYNFFAPEPSPSTILDFEVIRADGTTVSGRIPDRAIHPGLLYQRHFLLAEHMGIRPAEYQHAYFQSYATHLCEKYGASKIHLSRLLHFPLSMEMVRDGGRLDDALSYKELGREEFACGEP